MAVNPGPPPVQIVPVRQMTTQQQLAIRAQVGQDLIALLGSLITAQNLVVRPLVASDLFNWAGTNNNAIQGRMTNPVAVAASITGSGVYPVSQFVSAQVTQQQTMAFFGYSALSASPQLDQITYGISAGGTFAWMNLDDLYCEQVPTGYHEPVFFQNNEQPLIGFVSSLGVAQYAEQFNIIGLVCEQSPGKVSANRPEIAATLHALAERGVAA